jgi:hypothetical protein
MRGVKIVIIFCAVCIFNLNCDKAVTNPEVITIGVTVSEWWNGVNYLRFIYIGEGRVVSDGGRDCIYGICFSSINESPTISYAYSSGVLLKGSFQCNLNLQNGQIKYYLRAFAKNKAGISYGETVTYTTYCTKDFDVEFAYKAPPQLITPSNGAIVSPLSVTLFWIYGPGGICDLYLDTLPDVTKKIASDVRSPTYKIDSLKSATTYYWKVVKRWPPCKDISSVINKFTTTQ